MASVTVSSTTTTTKVSPIIHFDSSYIKTIPGMLKVGQILTSLIGFICVQSAWAWKVHSSFGWYSFVSMTAFWVTLVLLIFYLIHLIEKLHFLPWLLGELGYCGIWTIFYVITGIVAATNASHDGAWGAASFFAFVGFVLYGFDTFLKFKAWRSGGIAQGERTVTSSTATGVETGPSYPTY